ncbi:hypothetical protein [aff. Roholtiella sp. LEGE 12411]|uniref:hypothetical protein n=1 Tax=aff. Roholtiella sp. LEGE 12411 TaxID=1828822 RepID=UPI00187F6869|nr:hypothetical protein [aff. Roholtiella sp. LEGE 12411]MBE9037762.1 hypothetical protein [aff. Roholtiella sp. LEGE 12411]
MKLNSSIKLGYAIVSSSSLAAVIIGLGGISASAQITIQSTGILSGTIQLPRNNPNFNNRVTRVDTDDNGTYSRNEGSKSNPNYVPVYKSEYVKVETRSDGSLHYFVDFKGIPVVSFDGVLSSPVLSGGELQPYTYQGKLPGTKFQGVVQDEFGLTRASYTGIVTDPKTGNQYQGTFELNGQGPRYSDRNGGTSPTVFDFKSDIPGSPSVTSLTMTKSPLVRLTIKVPTTATLITPAPVISGGSIPTPAPVISGGSIPTPAPVISGGSIPTPTPVISGGSIPTPTPVISGGSIPTPAPVISSGSIPTPAPVISSGSIPTPTPVVGNDSAIAETVPQILVSPTPTAYTSESTYPSPSATPNIEFNSGNSSGVNRVVVNPSTLTSGVCSQNSGNSCIKPSLPKQAIGPRSRVLLR